MDGESQVLESSLFTARLFSFYFISSSSFRTQIDLMSSSLWGRKILIFVYYLNVCGYLFNCNWTRCKHLSRRTSHVPSPLELNFFFGFNLNLFLIHHSLCCGSSRIPSRVSPGSNCTVISFSDFLIKIYSVRCN